METGKNQEIDPQSLSLDDDKELIEFDQCIFDLRSEYIHKQNVHRYSQVKSLGKHFI